MEAPVAELMRKVRIQDSFEENSLFQKNEMSLRIKTVFSDNLEVSKKKMS